MKAVLAVFLGGGLGSVTRYGISLLVKAGFSHAFPLATLISNLISTAILGVVSYSVLKNNLPQNIAVMITVGFCGGFSTFSTFSYETFELFKNGNAWMAVLNVFISVLLALSVMFLLAKKI